MPKPTTETKTFTITTSSDVMRRLERFFALLHYASSWGHSAMFGFPLDGDGSDKVKIEPVDKSLSPMVSLISGAGSGMEYVTDSGYGLMRLDRSGAFWPVIPNYDGHRACLLRDDRPVKFSWLGPNGIESERAESVWS